MDAHAWAVAEGEEEDEKQQQEEERMEAVSIDGAEL